MRAAGWGVRYEPRRPSASTAAAPRRPRDTTKRIWAQSRVRYARKHHGPLVALLEAVGVALGALTHAAVWFRPPASRAAMSTAGLAALARTSDLNGTV